MHQSVQSAIEAAKQGDNHKALGFLKQVLSANPNDIDAWLVLAAVVDDPQRKRQCLKRVLTLDPTNQVAREEMLDMDRAEMGGVPAFAPGSFEEAAAPYQEEPAPASTPLYQSSESYSTGEYAAEPALGKTRGAMPGKPEDTLQTPPPPTTKPLDERPQVFQYPLAIRTLMYFFVVVPGCGGLFIATQSILIGAFFLGIGLLMLVAVAFVLPKVEIRDSGIRVTNMFSGVEVPWDGILKIKSNTMKRRLELFKKNGDIVKVSTQVDGYPQIVEIIRKRRPDLFGAKQTSSRSTSAFEANGSLSTGSVNATSMPTFAGNRIFKKSFFRQYGPYFLYIPALLYAVFVALTQPQYRLGAGISVFFLLVMIILPLFQVSAIKLEPNKLTVESVFEEKVLNAKDIGDIKLQTVRGRYGRATNFVNILPVKGKNYPLLGFSEGEEIIYGVLINWWNSYR